MKRALNAVISLYPKTWRDRYESEFQALLDDVAPTWGTFFNVLGGAMKMQFKTGKSWKIVAACALVGVIAGAIAGAAIAFAMPERFASAAVLRYDSPSAAMNQLLASATSDARLRDMVQRLQIHPGEAGAERTVREHLHIEHAGNGPAIMIRFDDRNRYVAQKVVADVVSLVIEQAVSNRSEVKLVELLDPASLPLHPFSPKREMVAGAGLFVGFLAAVMFGTWRFFTQTRQPRPGAGTQIASS